MDLQAIEARLAAATPGPWSRSGYDVGQVVYGPGGQPDLIGPISTNSDIEDAEFIAHAPKDVRALIDEVGRLTVEHLEMRIERDNLRERRDYYRKALMKANGEIEAVKALHFPADLKLYAATVKVCATCEVHEWPCPTMRALGVTEQ